ncbi:MAG: ATP-binding protein [Hyphomonadaceae bacterium]|nr:ATP-binding protein [Hyphomonadaceae bacterium]
MSESELIPFEFEAQRVIELLAKQIYQSPLALLRENTQNAFDAVRLRLHKEGDNFSPRIDINLSAREITVEDNGIGMTPQDLRQHFWRAGSSSKNTAEARAAGVVGTFGIGAMASFGIADALTVETQSIFSGERSYSHAERAKLSLKEDCVQLKKIPATDSSGTKVIAHVSAIFNVNVEQAKSYIAEFVSLVGVPVFVNGELVSQKPVEAAVPKVPEAWRSDFGHTKFGERLAASGTLIVSNNADMWLSLSSISWDGLDKPGRIVLRSGMSTLRTFRSGFGLSTVSVSSAYQFGGVADFMFLEPTAGREAITTDGVQLLQSMMVEIDQFASIALSAHDECDLSTPFMSWVSRHKRVDLMQRLRATISPGDRIALSELAKMTSDRAILYYEGADQTVIKLHASDESPVLVLARGNPRRQCEQLFIASRVKTELITDTPKVKNRKPSAALTMQENALAFRLMSILDSDYFLKSDVSFGQVSHSLPLVAEKNGEIVFITLNSESPSVRLLLGLYEQDYSAYSGMAKDFARTVVFPRIADYVPSSTRQGAEAFLKAIRKSRELFEYEDSDLGSLPQIWEDQLEGRITVEQAVERSRLAVRTSVQVVEPAATAQANEVVGDVIANEAALQASSEDTAQGSSDSGAAPAITRVDQESKAKLLTIKDGEAALRGYRCFLAISDRAREEMGEFFLQPHRTSIVWGGQKTLFIFLHHSEEFGLYYDLQTREAIDAPAGGGAFPTATIVLKDRIFIPIPEAIRASFIPASGEKKRFEVRADIIHTEQSKAERSA